MLDITHVSYLNLLSFQTLKNRKERNFFGKHRNTFHISKPKEAPSVLHMLARGKMRKVVFGGPVEPGARVQIPLPALTAI